MPTKWTGAGEYRHLMQFQRGKESVNALGETSINWANSTYATRHVAISPIAGAELYAAQQVQAEVTHVIKLRWLSGVIPKDRGIFQGCVFNFDRIFNLEERNIEMKIWAKEEVA